MSLFGELKKDYKKYSAFREHVEKGRDLLKEGDFSAAYEKLSEAAVLKFDTDRDNEYHFLSGLACMALKKAAESISHFEQCADPDERTIPFYYLGLAYHSLGANRKAAECFRLAARGKSVHPDIHYRIGLSCLEQGDFESAEKEFAVCADAEPADDIYKYELDNVRIRNGNFGASPGKAEIESLFFPIRLLHLETAIKTGRIDDAKQMASKFGENTPPRFWFLQGIMAHEKGDFDASLDAFRKSLEEAPIYRDDIRVRLKSRFVKKARSGVPVEAARCEEAFALDALVKRYYSAVACDPAEVWERTGDVHAARGFFNEAVTAYESGLKTLSSDTVFVKLSLIFILRKQYAEAIRSIRQTTGPDALAWQKLIESHCAAEQGEPLKIPSRENPETETAAYDALYHLAFGKAHARENETGKAIDCFIQAKRTGIPPFSFHTFLVNEAEARLDRAYALKSGRNVSGKDPGANLYSLLSRAYELFRRNRLDAYSAEAANIIEEFDRPLLVAVAGEFNAGKSTFINAMLGREIVPCGIRPTTATINILKYGPEPKIRIHFENGVAKTDEISRLEGYIRHPSDADADGVSAAIELVEIFLPEEHLQNVNIVDTPGFNSEFERHDRVSEEYLKKSDAVIWLFSADRAGTLSEFGMLGPLRDHVRKTVAVINKTDIVRNKNDIGRLVESVSSKAGQYVSAIRTVSAGQALSGKLDNDELRIASSEWNELESFLENELFSSQKDVKYSSTLNKLKRLFDKTAPSVEESSERLGRAAASFKNLEETVLSDRQKTERFVIPKYKVRVSAVFAAMREVVAEKIAASIMPPKKLLDSASVSKADKRDIAEMMAAEISERMKSEIGQAALAEISEMGRRIVGGMSEFLVCAGLFEGEGFQETFEKLVRGKEEFFEDLLVAPGTMYFKGYLDSGVAERIISRICMEYEDKDAGLDRIREILAGASAAPEKIVEQSVEAGFKTWSESHFRAVGEAMFRIRLRLERREYDVNHGLRRLFLELRKEAGELPKHCH